MTDLLEQALDSYHKTAMRVKSERDSLVGIAKTVVAGFEYDPGHSDLDNEQPIHVSMTLGDYRRARRLLHQLE